jgi:hypothetical protein
MCRLWDRFLGFRRFAEGRFASATKASLRCPVDPGYPEAELVN